MNNLKIRNDGIQVVVVRNGVEHSKFFARSLGVRRHKKAAIEWRDMMLKKLGKPKPERRTRSNTGMKYISESWRTKPGKKVAECRIVATRKQKGKPPEMVAFYAGTENTYWDHIEKAMAAAEQFAYSQEAK